MSPRYRRSPNVQERLVDGVAFLAERNRGAVFKLSATGTALWRLLAQPVAVDEAVAVFVQAFPDEAPGDVEAQVRGLFEVLIEDALVDEVEA